MRVSPHLSPSPLSPCPFSLSGAIKLRSRGGTAAGVRPASLSPHKILPNRCDHAIPGSVTQGLYHPEATVAGVAQPEPSRSKDLLFPSSQLLGGLSITATGAVSNHPCTDRLATRCRPGSSRTSAGVLSVFVQHSHHSPRSRRQSAVDQTASHNCKRSIGASISNGVTPIAPSGEVTGSIGY